MKKFSTLLTFLILVGIFIPAVSATDITALPYTDTQSSQTFGYAESSIPSYVLWGGGKYKGVFSLKIDHVENYPNVHYFRAETAEGSGIKKNIGNEGYFDVWYSRPSDGSYQKGVIQNQKVYNALGQVTKTYISFWPTNWDVGTKTGSWNTVIYADNNGVKSSDAIYSADKSSEYGPASPVLHDGESKYSARLYMSYDDITLGNSYAGMKTHAEAYSDTWHNLQISQNYGSYTINLNRIFEGKPYNSVIAIYNDLDELRAYNAKSNNYESVVPVNDVDKIVITSGSDTYTYNMMLSGSDTPISQEPAVTVYIKNSQTGALIANANIVIDALVNGEYYPVANRTEPSGIFSITLQPTGGGHPNPDGYRLIATADGYNNPMPEINFTVDEYTTSIYCYLDPITGLPEDENNTFIDFFVRDMSANPISGATVNFGGYTLITNSAGYTIFEVDKSKTYSWTVSKSGYGSLTGNAVIGGNARHTINTVLAPTVTPTKPTAIPTSTPISPTPIMTAPTGEPVSNWLEWFAAHFGMILGGGAEIGKIFMWLCFAVPVGVYVGKEAKAGAAGFMAGAGIVTLFFVLIGWVPIWLLVLLALIIGLLYAKIINNPDNGGGR